MVENCSVVSPWNAICDFIISCHLSHFPLYSDLNFEGLRRKCSQCLHLWQTRGLYGMSSSNERQFYRRFTHFWSEVGSWQTNLPTQVKQTRTENIYRSLPFIFSHFCLQVEVFLPPKPLLLHVLILYRAPTLKYISQSTFAGCSPSVELITLALKSVLLSLNLCQLSQHVWQFTFLRLQHLQVFTLWYFCA